MTKQEIFNWNNIPLHAVTRSGNNEIVAQWLSRKADVTVVNDEGCTTLHLATEKDAEAHNMATLEHFFTMNEHILEEN